MVTLLIGACGQQTDEIADSSAASTEPATTAVPTDALVEPTNTAVSTDTPIPPTNTAVPTGTSIPVTNTAVSTNTPVPPTNTPIPPTELPELSQPEQLIASFTTPPETNGEVLVLYGQVVDVNGASVGDAAVEIWQTDDNGVYDHPGDPTTTNRDTTFQFYGSTMTDEAGWYAFRTIIPGEYEPRPRHIHFKVKQNGATILTSQFYFSDDIAAVQGEAMFEAVGNDGNLLLVQLVQSGDDVIANGRIVVDMGIGAGELTLTPSQAEGPYYPVVVVAEYDNDLTILP